MVALERVSRARPAIDPSPRPTRRLFRSTRRCAERVSFAPPVLQRRRSKAVRPPGRLSMGVEIRFGVAVAIPCLNHGTMSYGGRDQPVALKLGSNNRRLVPGKNLNYNVPQAVTWGLK